MITDNFMNVHQKIPVQNEINNLLPRNSPSKERQRKMVQSDAALLFRKRYLVCILVNVGMILIMILRSNLSIALVDMTANKSIQMNNETIVQVAEFNWDSRMKGFILSVFSIGYLFGPIGGALCLKLGAVTTYGISVGGTAVLTILTPLLIRTHLYWYIAARILEGVFESFAPCCNVAIFVLWALPHERARLATLCITGAHIGIAINYPLSGFLIKNYGWECMFYISGGASLLWSVIWLLVVSNDPTKDPLMTQQERNCFKMYVSESVLEKKQIDIPWKEIAKSKPVWAYLNEFFSINWVQSFLSYCLPLYIKDLYNVGIEDIGLLSGIPALSSFTGLIIAAFLCDYLRNNTRLSKPFLHRIFIAIGQVSFIIALAYCGLWADFKQSIICLSLAKFLSGTSETSYQVLVIDMFCGYTGLIRGFAVSATSLAFFLNPIVMGFMVTDHSRSSWNLYFLFLSIFNIWSLIIFWCYGSGKQQEWATPSAENIMNNDKSTEEKPEST